MKKRTILIVDDQVINRRILMKMLQEEYEILEAENGKEALSILETFDGEISAILLDIMMPVMDGYAVLQEMRKNKKFSQIPVIVSSQKEGDETELKALSLGAKDFIAKPYKGDIILHRLQNTIELRETASIVNRAEKDELTGIYNKQFFIARAEEILRKNPKEKYTLLCFGVERFKLVNDTYGIEKGDELLCYIASLIKNAIEPDGICGRFSSDQFYVLMPHQESATNEHFKPWQEELNQFPIEMDIKLHCGIYEVQDNAASVIVMCDWAQLASRKNYGIYDKFFTYYDDSIRQELFEEQFIAGSMQAAIDKEQFHVYYQPKYDLHTEMVAGAEALVRWIHPEKGFMSPGSFIPLFEKNGFITQLDRYVWERACKDIREWIDSGYPPVPVSVNVSRADIFNPKLAEILQDLIHKYEIPYQYLHLEITESAYTDNPEQIIEVVKNLHDMGFIIEMDDFGSGYSSLNMLAELPVDILKLDMKFVQSESKHTSGRGIMSFVISLAKWMKLSVIAEGVETAEQISSLRSMDCNYVQGFYYAKPMPKPEFEEVLTTVAVSAAKQIEEFKPPKKETSTEDRKVMLIVDDIEVNRVVLGDIFTGEFDIVEKEDGKAAMEYLEENYEKVEMVLLDLLMPVMDGFQVLDKMQSDEHLERIPIVVTSQGDMTAEERALDLGADDFISKPYSPQVVYHRVHNVLEIHEMQTMQIKQLSETRKREETLMDSIPGGVAIYHLKKDGRFETEYVSDGLAKMCGYTADEFLKYIKLDARNNVVKEDIPHLTASIMKGLENQTAIHEYQRIYTKSKQIISVRFDANLIFDDSLQEDDIAIIYAVHTKMSEESEDALLEQNRYRYILDNLDVAYFELDENGSCYSSDKYSLYAMSDEKVDDILTDAGSYDGIHPDDLPILFEFFGMKKKKLPKISSTLRLKMKDGSYRWTEMMGFFEYDDDGNRLKSIAVLRDVDTEWQNQNRKLQDALDAAEKANQSKTDFLARVSHDMRTPLNGILGLGELMKGKKAGESISHELDALKQSGKYLLNLINDTLDVSTIEHGELELHPVVCDGKAAFENIISVIKPEMQAKGIQLELRADNLPFTKLYIDISRVEQAVMNILSNAVKFTPEGGRIELIIENISKDEGIIRDRVIIRDNGIGMSDEFQQHVFEPFSQEHNDNKSVHRGSGLGMTIAKQCIEMMGGNISIISEEGKGTEVMFVLPLQVATRQQLDDWNSEMEQSDLTILKGKRVLLCEDHPLNAEIAMRLLERKGMIVEHAENGKIGLDKFKHAMPFYYDLILMDIRMPIMDGLECTRKIRGLKRSDTARIPIIAMTANAMSEDVKNAIDAGMSEHLGKPVEPSKLYRTLSEFLVTPNPSAGKKVLVVDDIEMNRAFVRKAIEGTYTVLEAGSGVSALEILKNDREIAAVVTDIQMPGMDGKELIKCLRDDLEFDDLVILANTIYGDHRQEDELLALGANDFVYKPSSPRIILMRLEHILRNR